MTALPTEQKLMTASAAARSLSISARKLHDLAINDAIPSLKIDNCRRYRPEHLDAWLDAGAPSHPGAASEVLRKFHTN